MPEPQHDPQHVEQRRVAAEKRRAAVERGEAPEPEKDDQGLVTR